MGAPRASLGWLAVGAALFSSFCLPWTGSGPGSTVTGFAAVGLLTSGAVAAWVPAWVAVPLAALPACGVLLALSAVADGTALRRARIAVFAVAGLLGLALAAATWWVPVLSPGPGSWLAVAALAGGSVLLAGALAPRRCPSARRGGRT